MKYTLTNESVTVIHGGKPVTHLQGSPQFQLLKKAILVNDWTDIDQMLSVYGCIEKYLGKSFRWVDDELHYEGIQLPAQVQQRIYEMAGSGESPEPVLRFFERLAKNTSYRSVQQLFDFLKHANIPLEADGHFLAYKAIREDYTDVHTGNFSNKPGARHKMPRNQISDDPNLPCHVGFHVGSLQYAQSFYPGGIIVICRVDPQHVVCVPYDADQQKVRVCEYSVIGEYGAPLDNGVHRDDEVDEADEETTLAGLTSSELMEKPMSLLRWYAAKELKIVGASKMAGGKSALVSKIVRVRKRLST
jgi:hypothetical protein